jgi:hypothetical protein
VTLKAVNEELGRLGHGTTLARGDGYFYFREGESTDWLDRTVRVATLQSLTLAQWIDEFRQLKKLNADLMGPAASKTKGPP